MKPKQIFDTETDADILSIADLAPDMRELFDLLIEHVGNGMNRPLCGAKKFEPALLVSAGLASDCMGCRTAAGNLGNLKEHPQREVQEWTPQPMEGAETMLAEKQKRSDGR